MTRPSGSVTVFGVPAATFGAVGGRVIALGAAVLEDRSHAVAQRLGAIVDAERGVLQAGRREDRRVAVLVLDALVLVQDPHRVGPVVLSRARPPPGGEDLRLDRASGRGVE